MTLGRLRRCAARIRSRSPIVGLSLAIAFFALSSPAQQSATPSSQLPVYTLHGSSRIVLTDVTVKDREGHLVHGLPQSAFHIFDNNQSQTLTSFEEHNAAPTAIAAQPVSTPDTYSNAFLQHLPPVLNIVVLDTTWLSLPQQMYLAYEFNRFLKTLPPNLPIALYARVGETCVLVQDFTSDHALLLTASAKVMPRLPPPGRDPYRISELGLLHQLSVELAQLPGRKNVIWFTSQPRCPLDSPPTCGDVYFDPNSLHDPSPLREAYDLLEKARISVYPVDAPGLQVNPPSFIYRTQMEELAEGTGGEAFYNRNALDQISNEVLRTDNSFYTLVFPPKNFIANNKWHNIKVTVDGGKYQLSYRRGYFADGVNMAPESSNQPRTLLLANGKSQGLPADLRSLPIIFTASIVPVDAPAPDPTTRFHAFNDVITPKRGQKIYTIRYSLPPDVFATSMIDNRENASFDVAVLAFNQAGEKVGGKGDHVSLKFPQSNPHIPVNVAQNIALDHGDLFLYIAVWDATTGRAGTLEVPFTVK